MFSPQHGRLVTWLQTNTTLFVLFLKTELKGVLNLHQLNSKNNLFIYKLRQEAWITRRASSTTRSRKKKKKISNTTNKNDNTLIEMTKKRNANAK